MDVGELPRRLCQLTAWLEAQEETAGERFVFSAPPHGRAYLTVDPDSSSPAASFNHNRIVLCGTDGGLTEPGLRDLVQRFGDRGIRRMFVWLNPGPGIERVREWLAGLSFVRVPWTRYPTLLLTDPIPVAQAHAFEIREIGVAAFAAAKTALEDALFSGYARTLAKPGFHHFVCYDEGRPIAAAALVKFENLGYLTYASTAVGDRRRGAQSALIAHRIGVARALGCEHIVSQTLTMLEDSFANLQRCGFREIYEQEVYERVIG